MKAWRHDESLCLFFAADNYIKTPLQHSLFESFQRNAHQLLLVSTKLVIKEPVKLCGNYALEYLRPVASCLDLGAKQKLVINMHVNHRSDRQHAKPTRLHRHAW
jgi:hypothetical protein